MNDSQELMLLFLELSHDQAYELDVGVPDCGANLIWSCTSSSHSLPILRLLGNLSVVLMHLLQQLRPAQATDVLNKKICQGSLDLMRIHVRKALQPV